MRRNKLIVRPADLLVKLDVWSATQTASLSRDCGMKNSADKQRITTNMRAKHEGLLRRSAVQSNQDIGDVLLGQMIYLVGNLKPTRMRKCFEQPRNVIAKLYIADHSPAP